MTRYKIVVKPNSAKNEIVEKSKDSMKINIAAPADKNKANKELVRFLSKTLKKKVRIVSGLASRNKVIEVTTD